MEALIALGHPPELVGKYTPRNTGAWLFAAEKRRAHERRQQLALMRMAMHADAKTIGKALKDEQ